MNVWPVAFAWLMILSNTTFANAQAVPDVYCWPGQSMSVARERVVRGDSTLAEALARLVREAEAELAADLVKVTDKPAELASMVGGANNYASVSGYFWPDERDSAAPWVMRDGKVNHDMIAQFDGPRMSTMQRRVITLCLAYYYTGDERYGRRAAQQVRAWFIDPETRMNPHMEFAQCVPNKSRGEPWGIIDANLLPYLLDGVALLSGSEFWSAEDDAELRVWFGQFTEWLWNSDLGRREREYLNNHGTFYDLLVARSAIFAGKNELARQVVATYGQRRIATQIQPDGSTPHEQNRVYAAMYTCWNLKGMADMLLLGRRLGIDLWAFETSDGRSLKAAIHWLKPYVIDPSTWPYGDGKFKTTSPTEFFWIISATTRDPGITEFFRRQIKSNERDDWRSNRWMLLAPVD